MGLESDLYHGLLRLAPAQALEELSALERRLFEVVPTTRNFSLVVREREDKRFLEDRRLTIVLEGPARNTFLFDTLLPDGAHFWASASFGYYVPARLVCVPLGHLRYRGSLLALAHELGHAHLLAGPSPRIEALAKANEPKEREQLYELIIQEERDAWAFALRALRHVQRKGFQVFAGFESKGDIYNIITCNLLTYECGRKARLLELRGGVH